MPSSQQPPSLFSSSPSAPSPFFTACQSRSESVPSSSFSTPTPSSAPCSGRCTHSGPPSCLPGTIELFVWFYRQGRLAQETGFCCKFAPCWLFQTSVLQIAAGSLVPIPRLVCIFHWIFRSAQVSILLQPPQPDLLSYLVPYYSNCYKLHSNIHSRHIIGDWWNDPHARARCLCRWWSKLWWCWGHSCGQRQRSEEDGKLINFLEKVIDREISWCVWQFVSQSSLLVGWRARGPFLSCEESSCFSSENQDWLVWLWTSFLRSRGQLQDRTIFGNPFLQSPPYNLVPCSNRHIMRDQWQRSVVLWLLLAFEHGITDWTEPKLGFVC